MKKLSFKVNRVHENMFEYLIPTTLDDQKISFKKGTKEIHKPIKNEENLYFYLSVLSTLMKGKKVYGIPCWDVVPFILTTGYPFNLVKWQCNLDFMYDNSADKLCLTDNGVQKATTTPLDPPYPKWDNNYNNRSAVFKLKKQKDFINLMASVKNDIYGEINLFGLSKEHKKEDFLGVLNQKKKPGIAAILEHCDFVIDFVFGIEEEYQDCMVIKSKTDLTAEINACIEAFDTHQIRYDEEIDAILKKEISIETEIEKQKLTA